MEKPKTKLEAFYQLQAQVCELLPSDAVITAVKAGKVSDLTRASNVVKGLTKDLGLLVKIVECALPLHQVSQDIKKFV
jgi:hypothetical protein